MAKAAGGERGIWGGIDSAGWVASKRVVVVVARAVGEQRSVTEDSRLVNSEKWLRAEGVGQPMMQTGAMGVHLETYIQAVDSSTSNVGGSHPVTSQWWTSVCRPAWRLWNRHLAVAGHLIDSKVF